MRYDNEEPKEEFSTRNRYAMNEPLRREVVSVTHRLGTVEDRIGELGEVVDRFGVFADALEGRSTERNATRPSTGLVDAPPVPHPPITDRLERLEKNLSMQRSALDQVLLRLSEWSGVNV